MKDLKLYIKEAEESENTDEQAKLNRRGNIKFTIWEEPDKKVKWLKSNDKYQKIEYKHEDKTKKMFIDFLLGYDKEHDTWKLWVGKIGGVTYDDDPLCDLKTDNFAKAIVSALDEVEEYIDKVEQDPSDWIQYYKNI
jgi:hypothetical protein